jgi:uncharacterized membrane protein
MNDQGSNGAAPQPAITKFMAAIFEDDERAAQGERAVLSLKREGTLSVCGIAVVARGPAGQLSMIVAPNGPSTEALTALLSKLSAAVSALPRQALGLLTNLESWGDLVDFGVTPNFIQGLATALLPGKAAVIAEIEEDWITPLDQRIEAIGGHIMRTWRSELEAESRFAERQDIQRTE